MDALLLIGRILFAILFVTSGLMGHLGALPQSRGYAESVAESAGERLPEDPEIQERLVHVEDEHLRHRALRSHSRSPTLPRQRHQVRRGTAAIGDRARGRATRTGSERLVRNLPGALAYSKASRM